MWDNYTNLSFKQSNLKPKKSAINNEIILITAANLAIAGSYPASLEKDINLAFTAGEHQVFIMPGLQKSYIVVVPNKKSEELRRAGSSLYYKLHKESSKKLIISGLEQLMSDEAYSFLEGMALASYDFVKYKTANLQGGIILQLPADAIAPERLTKLETLLAGIALTKNMVNETPSYMNALKFGATSLAVAKRYNFHVEVLDKAAIEALGMGGLLAVNRGSATAPTFTIMQYSPKNAVNSQPLVLVGKGVMFDTGGYSLKAAQGMQGMKCDMAGAAAVLGTIAAIAGNKLPYKVVGLVPATDNMISANALVLDDIICMMDGTTVEIQNTDAEGRLLLGDALHYAKRFNPELVIDIATLTGASTAITGTFGIAALGNTETAMQLLKNAAVQAYERIIELPIWPEHEHLLQSKIADIKNIGGPIAGSSTAAAFLKKFTDYPWIHLDIAGAAFLKESEHYKQTGASATPVRLLYEFVNNRIKSKS